ncbi:hypothetical protein K450DRAFT_247198 [Umbelopsis ramanniana AG]|uniref:Uncharacterized protein n=1 Tax=Umbelopsis ramanniana AG TaxID=1314678 RepID=A0AAD5E8W2_UMBRA|nr:uncharacterized protein K450DRAFT_247198 [Umbelopsis ramanniana AG]KAI8578501.1 hypothetical protein K450DRAFT_247198 [Umbelopsis ramanniana AG]
MLETPLSTEPVTQTLSEWVAALDWVSIPDITKERAQYLILDGLTCALVAAHLPWSETAVDAILRMESPSGTCPLIGWKDKRTGPLPAALINSALIQGFELDDYHSIAPLHSNSIILPALLSLVAHLRASNDGRKVTGKEFLVAAIAGYEVGPRVGMALGGGNILSRGWHSGTVFGHAASAAASSRLLNLDSDQIEDAFGIACTQACGLMSAQFESSVKRMQHGFASRNGLFSALMAEARYKGISKVFERPYGGFLSVFANGGDPPAPSEVIKDLSVKWQTMNINVKPYACMGGIHATIDCLKELQSKNDIQVANIRSIQIEMSEPAFKHGGWKAEKPIAVIGAQMNAAYIAAAHIIDGDITMHTFSSSMLNREELWRLEPKIEVMHQSEFDQLPNHADKMCTRTTIVLMNGEQLTTTVVRPTGVKRPLTSDEIITKFHSLTSELVPENRQQDIIQFVKNLENCNDMSEIFDLLNFDVPSPIA